MKEQKTGSIRWYSSALGKSKGSIQNIIERKGKAHLEVLYREKYGEDVVINTNPMLIVEEPVQIVPKRERADELVFKNQRFVFINEYNGKEIPIEGSLRDSTTTDMNYCMSESASFLVKGTTYLNDWIDTPVEQTTPIGNDKARIILKHLESFGLLKQFQRDYFEIPE